MYYNFERESSSVYIFKGTHISYATILQIGWVINTSYSKKIDFRWTELWVKFSVILSWFLFPLHQDKIS